MANGFSKEVKTAFDRILEGFDDGLVVSRMAKVTKTDQQQMERTSDTIWYPQPYIMTTYAGNDATANFKDVTQLSVPANINEQRHAPWFLTARELRDQLQSGLLVDAAKERLSSDINVDVMNKISSLGSLVVKRTVAASGFDDLALADSIMTEQGVGKSRRVIGLSPRDYNNMAGNLAKPQTSGLSKTETAYEEAYLGKVAGFSTYKMDYAQRLTAAAGVGVTITNTQPLFYTPVSTTDFPGRGKLNVDNRFQVISIAVTSGTVKVGDCFQFATVNAVHHITKQDAGQAKTFRITRIVTGAGGTGTVEITPPIISGAGGTPAELQYQNVTNSPANAAPITFLNTAAAYVNPFWQGDALQIFPGRLDPQESAGMAVMRASTDQGFELVMTAQGNINDLATKYRIDLLWGVLVANTEMAGIELFSQV